MTDGSFMEPDSRDPPTHVPHPTPPLRDEPTLPAPEPEAPDPGFPRGWGRYAFQASLGEGGMGRVYKAYDVRLHRSVALKFLRDPHPELVGRFFQEAQAQARISHPHVAQVYEVGEFEGRPFLAMQYVEGMTLGEAAPSLGLEEKVTLFQQVCEGLHAAHRLGILHRDVKPGNVMLERTAEEGWRAYVMDFGLAREISADGHTMEGLLVGTPAYMSPEQAKGEHASLDRRSDVYALGATLYDLVTGHPPFSGVGGLDLLLRIQTSEPPAPRRVQPALPQDLETIVLKAMEKNPARRYDSAKAMGEDLQRYLEGEPILARRASLLYRLGKRLRKHRLVAGVLAASLLGFGTLAGYGFHLRLRAQAQARLAQRYTQAAQEIENRLRLAFSLPAHDVRGDIQAAREGMERLRKELAGLEPWAEGPGRYALARGHLILGEFDEARSELEKAWALEYRTPEVAHALGLTLARLYQVSLHNLGGKTLAEKRVELEETLRRPALAYLRQAAGSSTYAEGLMAFLEDHPEEALAKAKEARRLEPWRYEALLLESEVHAKAAMQLRLEERFLAAESAFRRALLPLKEAQELARSAPGPREAETELYAGLAVLRLRQGRMREADVARVINAADAALVLQPEGWRSLQHKAEIEAHWAERLVALGKDPAPAVERSLAASRQVLELRPNSTTPHLLMGWAMGTLAQGQRAAGVDPRPALDEAIAHNRRALGEAHLVRDLQAILGGCFKIKGEYELEKGLDPMASLEEAAACYERSLALQPARHRLCYLGEIHLSRARYLARQGRDPGPALSLAEAAYLKALDLVPGDPQTKKGLEAVREVQRRSAR